MRLYTASARLPGFTPRRSRCLPEDLRASPAPTSDLPRTARMFAAPSVVISGWQQGRLVRLSRSLTDHAYCCDLSDLAVDKQLQGQAVGKGLIRRTQAVIGEEVSLILLSAPNAMSYCPAVGFRRAENAFVIRRER